MKNEQCLHDIKKRLFYYIFRQKNRMVKKKLDKKTNYNNIHKCKDLLLYYMKKALML